MMMIEPSEAPMPTPIFTPGLNLGSGDPEGKGAKDLVDKELLEVKDDDLSKLDVELIREEVDDLWKLEVELNCKAVAVAEAPLLGAIPGVALTEDTSVDVDSLM